MAPVTLRKTTESQYLTPEFAAFAPCLNLTSDMKKSDTACKLHKNKLRDPPLVKPDLSSLHPGAIVIEIEVLPCWTIFRKAGQRHGILELTERDTDVFGQSRKSCSTQICYLQSRSDMTHVIDCYQQTIGRVVFVYQIDI